MVCETLPWINESWLAMGIFAGTDVFVLGVKYVCTGYPRTRSHLVSVCLRLTCVWCWLVCYDRVRASEFYSEDRGFDPLAGQGDGQVSVPPSQLLCRLVRA